MVRYEFLRKALKSEMMGLAACLHDHRRRRGSLKSASKHMLISACRVDELISAVVPLAWTASSTFAVVTSVADRSGPCSLRPFTKNLEASPTLEVCGVTKMPDDEWIRTFADGKKVKFSHDELMDNTFITP